MPRKHIVLALISVLLLFSNETATAQSAKDKIVGTWTLVSFRYVRRDGSAIEPFGPDVKGMLVFDGTHFSTQAIAANLPKFISNIRMIGTSEGI